MQIQQAIEAILTEQLEPVFLDIENESHNHSVPPNSETHFKLVVVADSFTGMRQVQRHQKIYGLLKEQMAGPVHALAIHTFSPEEWAQNQRVAASPDCMGGSKAEN